MRSKWWGKWDGRASICIWDGTGVDIDDDDEEEEEREKRRKGTERRDAFCGGQEAGERRGQAVAGERGPPTGDLEHSMDASQKRTAVDVEASCADDGNSKET